jgi:hypothetical protein
MQELYELTKRFNDISGATKEVSEISFMEQYSYIREEFNELTETMHARVQGEPLQLVEVLDDCLDIVITVFGLLQKLETLGVDVNEAAIATAENNLSKYPMQPAVAHETVDRKARDGVKTLAKFNEEFNCYTLRNVETGKVVKPYNFISNDLSKFVPKDLEVK